MNAMSSVNNAAPLVAYSAATRRISKSHNCLYCKTLKNRQFWVKKNIYQLAKTRSGERLVDRFEVGEVIWFSLHQLYRRCRCLVLTRQHQSRFQGLNNSFLRMACCSGKSSNRLHSYTTSSPLLELLKEPDEKKSWDSFGRRLHLIIFNGFFPFQTPIKNSPLMSVYLYWFCYFALVLLFLKKYIW
jgi:hypothetical protein